MTTTTKTPETATLIVPAEYRASAYDPMTFPASAGRPERTLHRVNHQVEFNDRAFTLVELLEAPPAEPFKYHVSKGTRVNIGLHLEVASCLTMGTNGKPKENKGFFRMRVLYMTPIK